MPERRDQIEYFEQASYRSPESPAVLAYTTPKLEFVRQVLKLPRDSRVLDLACGSGVFSAPLSREFDQLTCVDFSPAMLRANRWGTRCLGDALHLPFRDRCFDLVFEANLLHHATDPVAALRELGRVGRRYAVLVEPSARNPLMAAFSALVPAERAGLRFTPAHVAGLARAAGLEPFEHFCTGMITQNLTPAFMVPFLRPFDGRFPLGMYQLLFLKL